MLKFNRDKRIFMSINNYGKINHIYIYILFKIYIKKIYIKKINQIIIYIILCYSPG
jgi:hypothetical protein